MAVTLSAADVMARFPPDVDQAQATALLATSTAMVDQADPDRRAPDAVANEAALRYCGWLLDAPSGGVRMDKAGDFTVAYSPRMTGGFRASGALAMLAPFVRRRAGAI